MSSQKNSIIKNPFFNATIGGAIVFFLSSVLNNTNLTIYGSAIVFVAITIIMSIKDNNDQKKSESSKR